MSKEVIAYLHTHWDREWYREFEIFRMRLLRVFDNVLELLAEKKIPSFYFDGQVSAIEDYLEMRPEKEKLVQTLIKQKKLFIGPFYCLVDEFLTNKNCFIKNLEIGMKKAISYGCTDFIGYLPDTFGHSQNVVNILKEFGIDKCVVWRGCGDFPSEFKWCGINTVNLVRGYFQDIFSTNNPIKKKAQLIKQTLDSIAEKSNNCILLPIGADHLGIEKNISEQIDSINDILKEDYHITLGSPFDYFKKVENNFDSFYWDDELRDNSKTFILQGCYSSRLDLKKENTECTYFLELAEKMTYALKEEKKYKTILEYAYKLLLQNQAHDSICGCSTDDVHFENLIRYKKIKQIANTIIDELKFKNNFEERKILNLSNEIFSGIVEFKSTENLEGYEKIDFHKGFDKYLLTDTQKIPVTEDYTKIYTYLAEVENLMPNELDYILPISTDSDLCISEKILENSNLKLEIKNNQIFINNIKMTLIDFIDYGDSYNHGPKFDDLGNTYSIINTKIILDNPIRATLRVNIESKWDIIHLFATLEKNSTYIKLHFEWNNTKKNHLLEILFELNKPIKTVFSEDMDTLIERHFDANYKIRENLPIQKGIEVKTNSAPMQRGLLIDDNENNLGIITKGLTQYEVTHNNLMIPILRATGQISNPMNPARTTPAGPPLEVTSLQQIGHNSAELYVFFGDKEDFYSTRNKIFNYIIT